MEKVYLIYTEYISKVTKSRIKQDVFASGLHNLICSNYFGPDMFAPLYKEIYIKKRINMNSLPPQYIAKYFPPKL